MQHDPASSNPFAHRPMSALGGKKLGGDVMVELDHPSNMPEGMDRAAWDHFVKARRRKVDSEQRVSSGLAQSTDLRHGYHGNKNKQQHGFHPTTVCVTRVLLTMCIDACGQLCDYHNCIPKQHLMVH